MDDRTLKPVFGQTHEQYSFCVFYQTQGGLFGMYVWADNIEEAKKEVKRRVPDASIKNVRMEWPR